MVSGTAPGTVDSAMAVDPDGQPIQGPPDAQSQAMDKEHAEMLLQVQPAWCQQTLGSDPACRQQTLESRHVVPLGPALPQHARTARCCGGALTGLQRVGSWEQRPWHVLKERQC